MSPPRPYRAGESIEDYCRACKTDRMHTVVVVDGEGVPIRVDCGFCHSEHNYRGGPRVGHSAAPQDSAGRSSNNLFGIKASADWTGATVTSGTQEFQGGAPTNTAAQFKAYATPAQSFQDYVALLRNNPRYSTALNTGGDLQAFTSGLQRGGYATDPDYANKIAAVAGSLKLSSALPISANTGAL